MGVAFVFLCECVRLVLLLVMLTCIHHSANKQVQNIQNYLPHLEVLLNWFKKAEGLCKFDAVNFMDVNQTVQSCRDLCDMNGPEQSALK